MKKHSNQFVLTMMVAMLGAGMMASCANTDIVSDKSGEIQGEEISINVSMPENLKTRAGSDHVLRYTAKLFNDKYNSNQGVQFIERKQGIASDGECTIVFKVPEGNYSVLIFADYIPASTSQEPDGTYEDRYYDTTSEDEEITMLAFTNQSGAQLLNYNCINNDNYDCFSGYTGLISKGPDKVEKTVVLKRAAARVSFVSKTMPPADVSELKFSKFSYYDTYEQFGESSVSRKQYQQMGLDNYVFTGMSNPSENEIFYFYSLAGSVSNYLDDIEFTVKFSNGDTRTTTIPVGTIRIVKNTKTIVNGSFLSDPVAEEGDIILYLSKDETWETPDITVN